MPTQIIMPQLGESVVEGTVTRWLKQEGETVEEMESLLEVNTDKVDTEIPSPASGTLLKIVVPEGETVQAGTVIAWVGQPGEFAPAAPGGGAAAPEEDDAGTRRPARAVQETVTPVTAADEASVPAGGETPGSEQTGDAPTRPVAAGRTAPAAGRSRELGFISPIVARLAQENDLDLTLVRGTGEGGRITKKDVLAYLEMSSAEQEIEAGEPAPWETPGEGDLFRPTEMMFPKKEQAGKTEPVITARPEGSETQPAAPAEGMLPGDQFIPHTPMRQRIAEHMVASKRTAPHVTTIMEADMQRVMAHYQANRAAFQRDGTRLTYTAYFVSAAVQALKAYPQVNSSWSDEGIVLHPAINIGLAVSLGEEGLIVPVLKGADGLSLLGLSRAIGDVAERARSRRLQTDEVRGGTFSITNHGISGSLFATPVINQPQCAILGVGAIQKRVVVLTDDAGGDSVAIRPMVYLSLTFDHRILDGASADGFLSKVVQVLEGWG